MLDPEASEFNALNQLTQQTDHRSLCRSAVDLTQQFLPTATCELLEVYNLNGPLPPTPRGNRIFVRRFPSGEEIELPSWLPLASGQRPVERPVNALSPDVTGTGEQVYCLGSITGVLRLLVVRGKRPNIAIDKTLKVLMSIFSNCLTILDKFERDPLTELFNRQSFDYRFEDVLARYRDNPRRDRISTKPWLAIADIDNFKRINDTRGHLHGDEILLSFARLLQKAFRLDDLLFRYGGEEFIVILNNTDTAGAYKALERFRQEVERYEFPAVGRMTVSLGWVGVSPNESPLDLIDKADRALYAAKKAGRNRIVAYETELVALAASASA